MDVLWKLRTEKKSGNEGSPYSRFKKIKSWFETKTQYVQQQATKTDRKSKAVSAKTCFIWQCWRLEHSNLHEHISKFWQNVSESGKAEGPTYIKHCMGLHEKTREYQNIRSNPHLVEGAQRFKKHLNTWLTQHRK